MNRNIVKTIIFAFLMCFSTLASYGQDSKNIQDALSVPNEMHWIDKEGVKIGYKLDHFSPTKKIVKKEEKKTKIGFVQLVVASAIFGCGSVIGWFIGIFVSLCTLGGMMLLIVKLLHKF